MKTTAEINRGNRLVLLIIIAALGIIMILNSILVSRTEEKRIEADGQMRLSSIAGRVDNSLYRSECLLDSVAMQIEQIISSEGDADAKLDRYFNPETIEDICSQSDGSCFSAYAAYNNKLYINDFIPDENFVLDERSWYVGAKKRMGAVHVTEPYVDASTGELCYSISKLLSDGSTVVGLDFSFNEIQHYIEEMSENGTGISLIVNDAGMIMGHSEAGYVGRYYSDREFYKELVNKVYMLYGDSFKYSNGGDKYNVFSDKINYDWYLIVCVKHGSTFGGLSQSSLYIIGFMVILSLAVVIFFVSACRSNAEAIRRLAAKDEQLRKVSHELKQPLSEIINRADSMENAGGSDAGKEITASAKELSRMIDEIAVMPEDAAVETVKKPKEKTEKDSASTANYRIKIALVTVVLLATGVVMFILNTMAHSELGNSKMRNETDLYLNQVKEWALENKTVLDVISDSIAAQDSFEADYDSAVKYLDNIVSEYDDISVAYLCNPEWEHTVIMNNGWEPDENWKVEERQWYIDTLVAEDNFNISAPYLDEQTGLYCTTLSKIVYDPKGNFIGILGIDYYIDKLVGILGESYTDTGYAFLTDIDGNILNHPNIDYQMKSDFSVNAALLCYRTAFENIGEESVFITDYDNSKKVCLAMKEDVSGFNVLVVQDVYSIFGSGIYSDMMCIAVVALCIIIVNAIMQSITRWQTKVNRELKDAAEQAINAGRAKNDFLANMSHEIRTPINAVLGMNEMIMRESSEENIVEYAANIQSAGRTLLSVINDILDFSKIESGKMEIVPVEYDVSSLVNDIVNMVKGRAEKKKLKFIPEIDKSIPAMLYGDDVRLRQIITNILTNAVKYTHEGHVRLTMKNLRILDGIIRLEVSVSDTGIGIKEDDLSKLFTSFQRLDQEKNRSIEGTGLGITIVQRLLNMMGSELSVYSVYGVGSTFSFVVEQKIINPEPMGDYELRFKASAVTETQTQIKTAEDIRILVVDDNETNLLVARSLLKRTKAKVDTALSGKECIKLLEANMYDIVFLDHMMPEMDGIETLKKIQEKQLSAGTVFIALTANAIHGARQMYLDAGFDDYLSKPFTGVDIEKCLFGHISRDMIKTSDTVEAADDNDSAEEIDVGSVLDVETALSAMGNSIEKYMDAVYDFCDSNRCNDIELDYSCKDYKSYRVNVKVAAESARKAGLTQLADAASKLADALNNNDTGYLLINHKDFIRMYRAAADNIEQAAEQYFKER